MGVIAAAGAIGFAIGIAGFARLGLDGIFRILNDLPLQRWVPAYP